jgi:N-acetylglucosamine-6-phosphate deacetylase
MTRYALHAGQFVLAGALREGGFLTIEDGRCGAWSAEAPDCNLVDYGDAWIAPGFVDTHIMLICHATPNIDPRDFSTGVELARRGPTSWPSATFTIVQIASCSVRSDR